MFNALERRIALGGLMIIAGCAAEAAPPAGTGGATGNTGGNTPGSGGGVPINTGGSGNFPAGVGGALPGTGGALPGSGGFVPGTGGVSPGTGGVAPGTGGALPGTGGVAPGTGGATSSCTSTGSWAATQASGFVVAGTWQGYGFTAGNLATVSPADFSMLAAGQALCACGSVSPDAMFGGTAMIGINLNQMMGMTAFGTITPSGSGITVNVTQAVPAPLRIQIQGPNGETAAAERWCADLPATGGTIPWTGFEFECWGTDATVPYDGTSPIAAVLVMVPGTNMAAVPFDFCITGLSGS